MLCLRRENASLQNILGKGGLYIQCIILHGATVLQFGSLCWSRLLEMLPVAEALGNKTRSPVRKLQSAQVVEFSSHSQQWNFFCGESAG